MIREIEAVKVQLGWGEPGLRTILLAAVAIPESLNVF